MCLQNTPAAVMIVDKAQYRHPLSVLFLYISFYTRQTEPCDPTRACSLHLPLQDVRKSRQVYMNAKLIAEIDPSELLCIAIDGIVINRATLQRTSPKNRRNRAGTGGCA